MKWIRSRTAEKTWQHLFSHYKSKGIFFQTLKSSLDRSRWSDLAELIQALMHVIATCKYEEDPIKNLWENVMTPFFPLVPYGSYLLPRKPEFWSDLAQNLMQPFPHPNDASDKIWLRLDCSS